MVRRQIVIGLLGVFALVFADPARGHINLNSPNGGEVLEAGSVFAISWQIAIAHNLQNWDIWYSTDSGANYVPIATDLPPGDPTVGSVHTYDWTVPDTPSTQVRVRVRMDNSGMDYFDESASDLTIVAAPGGTTHVVEQVGLSFAPANITVEPGDTVRWEWSSGIHTVTSGSPCVGDGVFFHSALDGGTTSFSYVIPDDGTTFIPYFCLPHCAVGMTGSITVTFHFMQIEQVIGGVNGDTTAQAVQLRMRSLGQNLLAPSKIRIWDAAGLNPVELVDFAASVPSGAPGARVLVASAGFANYTDPPVNPDFTMSNPMPPSYLAAGSITFESDIGGTVWWRLSWGGGSYMGPTTGSITNDPDGEFGPAWPNALPSSDLQALLFQGAAAAASSNNAADYALTGGAAVFNNNAGQSFTVSKPTPTGACCDDATGSCSEGITQAACEGAGSRYGGDGSTCATIDPPCLTPTGACCDDTTGTCNEGVTQAVCEGAGSRYGGDDSTCATIDPPCEVPTGACCDDTSGNCDNGITQADCEGQASRYRGDDSDCATLDPPCEPPPIPISLEIVAEGLTAPLFLTHAGDGSGRLFIVDQIGLIRVVKNGELLAAPFLDLTSKIVELNAFFDERGVLGLAFHPDYANNGRFFVRYSKPREGDPAEPCNDPKGFIVGCHEAILAEYSVLGDPATSDVADPDSETILYRVDEPQFNHDSGQVMFGPDGLLYWTLGDGGGAHDGLADGDPPGSAPTHGPIGNGQNIETALGSILRIDVDSPPDPGLEYAVPSGNPFASGCPKGFPDCVPEIYAYGFRNPYRFSMISELFDPCDENPCPRLIVGDVGQDLFEEIDIVPIEPAPPLLNYGWVIREGFHCFDPFNPGDPFDICTDIGPLGETMIDPVLEYDHSVGIAVIGGFVYRGSGYPPLAGKYVFGDFSQDFGPTGRVFYTDIEGPEAFELREFIIAPNGEPLGQALFGIGEDEDGELYVLASDNIGPTGNVGVVYRIVPPLLAATGDGARYLSITPTPGPDPVGLVVTPACPGGVSRYVGAPGDPDNIALLVDDPAGAAFLTPAEWGGTVHVTAADIVPTAFYQVQQDNGSPGAPALSGMVTAPTGIWGDVGGFFIDGAWEPPNGGVDFLDVKMIVEGFVNAATAPPMFRMDLIGIGGQGIECEPDQRIDFIDASAAVSGFQGVTFTEFTGCPVPCP